MNADFCFGAQRIGFDLGEFLQHSVSKPQGRSDDPALQHRLGTRRADR